MLQYLLIGIAAVNTNNKLLITKALLIQRIPELC